MRRARFWWRSTCTTCRAARNFLRAELGAELDERDYAKRPLNAGELRELFADHDPRAYLNPKSPAFKAMGLTGRVISPNEALSLFEQQPLLIKRPLTQVGSELVAGFDHERLRRLLS